jgi:hypothetical protein
MKTYTEHDQERAERAARRGFFGQCAALVAAAVLPERVYSFLPRELPRVYTFDIRGGGFLPVTTPWMRFDPLSLKFVACEDE